MINFDLCEGCPKFEKQQEALLDQCESVFDAVIDMQDFVLECQKACDRSGLIKMNKTIMPVQEMSNEDLVAFAKDTNRVLSYFHNRILSNDVLSKEIYEAEILGLIHAKDVINELVKRLGCYVADQEIWLSYNQIDKNKT